MWVSVEPKSGIVSAYPKFAQNLIDRAVTNNESEVFLGPKCFNATIKLSLDGNHSQHTPATSFKNSGFRSVNFVDNLAQHVDIYKLSSGIWTFIKCGSNVVAKPIPCIPEVVVWCWCSKNCFKDAKECDWIP